jgi:hypothetical protein
MVFGLLSRPEMDLGEAFEGLIVSSSEKEFH